jgi:acetoacetate decarboxylase
VTDIPSPASQAYSFAPWPFRGAEQISFVIDADAHPLAELLPPGVEIDAGSDGLVRCEVRICWYPRSAFGPFHETYVLVRARHHGELIWFLPLIMTDNDLPLSGGREVWGYAKKLAAMSWQWGRHTAGQVLFTMERPAGQRILTATFAPTRLADPSERVGYHVMSHRHITGGTGDTLSELVLLGGSKALQRNSRGDLALWAGTGGLTLDAHSAIDPWHLVRPREIHASYWQISDFALSPGRVVDDLTSRG